MDDRELELNFPALKSCLETSRHLFVDISRIKSEPSYEEKRGGFGDVQVSTLDPETPLSKLVAAKTIRLRTQNQDHQRLAFRLARELKVWAGLEHPHVLPLLGFYLDEEYKMAVLLSEYMVYGDLKDYTVQQKPSWEMRLHLVSASVSLWKSWLNGVSRSATSQTDLHTSIGTAPLSVMAT
ncbi:hypothetical protein FS837_002000 [Tulasnella sp. UAMH 9824]|nr:hypothetical protein FS837_002000 [Tulasnella sp. UAMH 9824]